MAHFSLRFLCAPAAARSCSPCCCFRSHCPRCKAWWKLPASFFPATVWRGPGSYCFSPTMWCLLLLAWHYSKPFCTRNEASLPHPRSPHGVSPGLCAVSGLGRGSYGAHHGRRAANFLLSRSLGMDGISTFPCEFCRV